MQEGNVLSGSSFDSFEDAARDAMGDQTENIEHFEIVSTSVERGGSVGKIRYAVLMRRLVKNA